MGAWVLRDGVDSDEMLDMAEWPKKSLEKILIFKVALKPCKLERDEKK